MRYDCVLFDLDGTLSASEEGILRSVQHAMERLGLPVPEYDALKPFIGPPLKYSFMQFCGLSDAEAEQAVLYYRERYGDIGWAETYIYPGLPALLKDLKAAGVKLGIATAKPQLFTEKIVDRFGLRPFVDTVCGIELTDHTADKRGIIRRAIPAGCERIAMVGDRRYDIEAANDLSIASIGVTYGYGTREELTEAKAGAIADTVEELREILLPGVPRGRGTFLSFEGSDGCGKTTQMKMLAEWLKTCGWCVKTTREPGGGPISEAIRALVLDPAVKGMTDVCEAYLFAASRAQHVRDTIRPALERGEVVLCDRFLDSSIAFQGAGRGLGMERVMQINREAVGDTMPDGTLLLTIDPAVAMQRRLNATAPDRIELEKQAFVDRVYRAFSQIADDEPQRVHRVDANGTVDEVQQNVRGAVLDILLSGH